MRTALKLFSLCTTLLVARDASAHFKLDYPEPWTNEDFLGDPQKDTPCGGEGGTPSGVVTTFRPGQTITVEWSETIYHPGHFRIALSANRADFIDPAITVNGNQISVAATIQDPPVAPVLLDGLYPRSNQAGSGGTVFRQDITLPNEECELCTLQVIQFMAGHGPPNYIYFHCADLRIASDTPDAGVVQPDAEVIENDAGMIVERDADLEDDAAENSPDALVQNDAEPNPQPDAGIIGPADAAEQTRADSGALTVKPTTTGSCGCSTTTNQGGSGPPIAAAFLIFAAGIRRWSRTKRRCSPSR